MKAWNELLTYQEQLNGRVDTKGLLRLVKNPEVQVLECVRKDYPYLVDEDQQDGAANLLGFGSSEFPELKKKKQVYGVGYHSIFRVVTLATCEAAYTFYGAGYHKNRGYIYNDWMFDLDLEAEPQKDQYNKKSIIVTIKRDVSWYQQKAAKKGKNVKGGLTAFSAIAFPSPLSSGD